MDEWGKLKLFRQVVPTLTQAATTVSLPEINSTQENSPLPNENTQRLQFKHQEWFSNDTKSPSSLHADFLINPVMLCHPSYVKLDYIFLVHTSMDHTEHRKAVRETFGQRHLYNMTSRALFVVGTTPNSTLSGELRAEANVHGDIVQGDFVDSYHNLTLKGIVGLRWIADHCTNTKYVIRIDDDVIVNIREVELQVFPTLEHTRSIACQVMKKNTKRILRKGHRKKWVVVDEEFPGLQRYPFDYCNGFVVLFTVDLIVPMIDAAKLVPFFWIDDIYLFGLLPLVIGNVHFTHVPKTGIESYKKAKRCLAEFGKKCPYMIVFNRNSKFKKSDVMELWTMMNG